MNTIEIPEAGIRQEVPACWDEMPPDQTRFALRLVWDMENGEISPLEFHVRMLYKLLNIHRTARTIFWEGLHPEEAVQKNGNIVQLCESLLDWIFTTTENGMLLTFDAIDNPLPEVRSGFYRLIGPGKGLCDLTLAEFRTASAAREDFLRTQSPEALDKMIAALYRRRTRTINRGGRPVGPIGHGTFEDDVRRASRIAPWQKRAILMWFSACIKFIPEAKITIAGEEVDMRELFRNGSESEKQKGLEYTWTDVAYELAKEQALGTLDDIDAEGLYTILLILWHNVKQAKRNERNSKP